MVGRPAVVTVEDIEQEDPGSPGAGNDCQWPGRPAVVAEVQQKDLGSAGEEGNNCQWVQRGEWE